MKTFLLLVCTFFPSSLRLIVWRFFGFKVGNNVHVSIFSVVVADFINIGSGAFIDSLSFIYRPLNLIIGERARVSSFIRIIGREGNVNLGSQTHLVMGCVIDSTGDFSLGSRSQIGPRSMIYTHGNSPLSFNVKYPQRDGPVIIGEDSWIGMDCLIFANTKIGNKVIVYPGTRVWRNQPDGKSLVPFGKENRNVQTDIFIQKGIEDEILHDRILKLFKQCAHYLNTEAIKDEKTLLWKVEKRNFSPIYLVLDEKHEIKKFLSKLRNAVIWKLYHNEKINSHNVIFCFNDWIIYGSKTNYTERIADFLLKKGGPFFIYKK